MGCADMVEASKNGWGLRIDSKEVLVIKIKATPGDYKTVFCAILANLSSLSPVQNQHGNMVSYMSSVATLIR